MILNINNMKNSIIFCLMLVFCGNLFGQNIAINKINVTPTAKTYRIDDLNGDGLPEIIATGSYWDTELYLNKGNFRFEYINLDKNPGISATFKNQTGYLDFDKDGDKDLVHSDCSGCGDSGVNLYTNENFTSFPKKLNIAASPGSSAIYDAFDINKDGYEDLIVSGNKTTYYLNDAGKGFKAGVALSTIGRADYMHHQDINKDGFIDLMAKSSKDVYIFLNNSGSFASGIKLTNYDLSGYISTKDLNGDGILDYYTAYNYCLKSMLSNAAKSDFFEPINTIYCGNSSETRHDLVDVDGDGDLDLIYGKTAGSGIYFKRKTANGFEGSQLLNHGGYQHSFYLVADFNKDGKEDILFRDTESMLGVFANNHNENNLPLYIAGELIHDFETADLDGDAQQDLISFYDEWIGVNYVKNNSFGEMKTIYQTEAKTDIYQMAVFDVDKDGDNDIVVALEPDPVLGTKPTLIWLENQNNDFSKINTLFTNQKDVTDIAVSDFDKDGDIDMVLTRGISTGTYLKNNGNGSFTTTPFYGTGRETKVIDFNKDGFDDVLSWRGNGDIVYYSENDKAGGFKARKNLVALNLIHDVEVHDIDSDGDFDLIVNGSKNSDSEMSLFYNNNFSFTTNKLITTNYTGTCLELSFENGPNNPTIITGGLLDLYRYIGNGNFSLETAVTQYYNYEIFKTIKIDSEVQLLAFGGENNKYTMAISGLITPLSTSTSEEERNGLSVYPNPASNRIVVAHDAFTKATVLNMLGIPMMESEDKEIDISGLPNGIYLIHVHNVGIAKVIKE